jgi:hypothetical protein
MLTKEKFVSDFLLLTALFTTIWASSKWIQKAIAEILWQLYDMFLGTPP